MTQEILQAINDNIFAVWLLIGVILIFWMQAGFAMVEAGFTRAKNSGNIIMKNLMDFCIGTVVFILIGFGLLFGEDLFGFIGFRIAFLGRRIAFLGRRIAFLRWRIWLFFLIFLGLTYLNCNLSYLNACYCVGLALLLQQNKVVVRKCAKKCSCFAKKYT